MKNTLLAALVAALLGSSSSRISPPEVPLDPEVAEKGGQQAPSAQRVRAAVERGLKYLKRTQDGRTGAWIGHVGYKFNSDYHITTRGKPHVGVTALALMAFLSGGHLPGRGEYSSVVEQGTNYLLSCVDRKTGYISAHGTRMYSHAFATLFLAEIYGMTHRTDVRDRLQLATDCTIKSQNRHGSWRYLPQSPLSDMSITVCQIMALRASRNIGLPVYKTTIDRAQAYVDRSAIKSRGHSRYGGFRYQETGESRTSFPLTAAGLATLFHAGAYGESQLMDAGLGYLKSKLKSFTRRHQMTGHYFFWYGQYYASQVFFFAEDNRRHRGAWKEFYWPYVSNMLLKMQRPDGSWPQATGPGPDFSTAIATIILQIPNQYLPIFQR